MIIKELQRLKSNTLNNSYAIYNTGTSYQTMFTLGNGYGTPSSATNYITNSTGTKVSNPKENSTPMVKQGNGYTWANGYQLTGYQVKQGYGLTTTWTVPINSGAIHRLHLIRTLHLTQVVLTF